MRGFQKTQNDRRSRIILHDFLRLSAIQWPAIREMNDMNTVFISVVAVAFIGSFFFAFFVIASSKKQRHQNNITTISNNNIIHR